MACLDNRSPQALQFRTISSLLPLVKTKISVLGFLQLTKHKPVDEPIQELSKAIDGMGTIDDVAIVLFVACGLSTELAPEEFSWVGRRAGEGLRSVGHVWDDGFDAVAFAFNCG